PVHTHVMRDNAEAKFWLNPVRLAWNRGFSGTEIREIEVLTQEHEKLLMEKWNAFFPEDS
ncbi:MAG: DUF4160 domain-containing protein, partial [Candidatus Hydrogenedentota bacterium]